MDLRIVSCTLGGCGMESGQSFVRRYLSPEAWR
jgi:hypothetical protein